MIRFKVLLFALFFIIIFLTPPRRRGRLFDVQGSQFDLFATRTHAAKKKPKPKPKQTRRGSFFFFAFLRFCFFFFLLLFHRRRGGGGGGMYRGFADSPKKCRCAIICRVDFRASFFFLCFLLSSFFVTACDVSFVSFRFSFCCHGTLRYCDLIGLWWTVSSCLVLSVCSDFNKCASRKLVCVVGATQIRSFYIDVQQRPRSDESHFVAYATDLVGKRVLVVVVVVVVVVYLLRWAAL